MPLCSEDPADLSEIEQLRSERDRLSEEVHRLRKLLAEAKEIAMHRTDDLTKAWNEIQRLRDEAKASRLGTVLPSRKTPSEDE
jgi:uncharacterized coiled-coil DUF342 family protein